MFCITYSQSITHKHTLTTYCHHLYKSEDHQGGICFLRLPFKEKWLGVAWGHVELHTGTHWSSSHALIAITDDGEPGCVNASVNRSKRSTHMKCRNKRNSNPVLFVHDIHSQQTQAKHLFSPSFFASWATFGWGSPDHIFVLKKKMASSFFGFEVT